MSAWDDLKGSLFAAGRDVSQKAKEVSEVAKLKMDIHTKEDFVEKQYAILGRAYYEANKDNVSEKDAEAFRVITEAIEEINRMNQQELSSPEPLHFSPSPSHHLVQGPSSRTLTAAEVSSPVSPALSPVHTTLCSVDG